MPKFLLFILTVATTLISCTGEPKEKSPVDLEADHQYLTHLKEVNWPKAYREQDTLLLDQILAEEFRVIRNDGSWSSKAEELDFIKNNGPSYDTLTFEIKRLDIFENGTAIVAGAGHVFGTGEDGNPTEAIYQSTNVLVKRDGNWKAVSSHVSGYRVIQPQDLKSAER